MVQLGFERVDETERRPTCRTRSGDLVTIQLLNVGADATVGAAARTEVSGNVHASLPHDYRTMITDYTEESCCRPRSEPAQATHPRLRPEYLPS